MSHFKKCCGIVLSAVSLIACKNHEKNEQPNVIILMTDDQGYGDFSVFGNPVVKTPNLDRLHDQSIRFTDFHVAPASGPTRSQLLTGVDAMHNGAYAPHGQHLLLKQEYTTLGDIFLQNGYNTALYGKWHLGGNFPGYRPHERGFQDAVYFLRGGHWSHPNYWYSDMMDDYYYHNGRLEKYEGYANDIWFRLGEVFVKKSKEEKKPFFLYLPVNSPHIPWLTPDENKESYLEKGLDNESVNFFSMIDAVDKSTGAFIDMLKKEDLWRNTIFIFLTDNGSGLYHQEYNAGLRGKKGSFYEGGHRVPLFLSWPDGDLIDPCDLNVLSQCQDVFPTLIDLCKLKLENEIEFDGTSLKGILKGEKQKELEDRILVVQMNEARNSGSVMWNNWRLVNGNELYNTGNDLVQEQNIAEMHPEVVDKLKEHYNTWWPEAEKTIEDPAPYFIGSSNEEYMLTAYDWYWGKRVFNWPHLRAGDTGNGKYRIVFEDAGSYSISLRRWPKEAEAAIVSGVPAFTPFDPLLGDLEEGKALAIKESRVRIGDKIMTKKVDKNDLEVTFTFEADKGETFLQTRFIDSAGAEFGAYYVYINKLIK
jgi:arylsulfatase A-like enzyme